MSGGPSLLEKKKSQNKTQTFKKPTPRQEHHKTETRTLEFRNKLAFYCSKCLQFKHHLQLMYRNDCHL